MPSPDHPATATATAWLNSILGRMLALAIIVVLLITAGGLAIVLLNRPGAGVISSYEIARAFRQLPIRPGVELHLTRASEPPAVTASRASRLVADAVATRLGLPRDAVRVSLEGESSAREAALESQYRLYAADGGFNPTILGGFSIAARQADGHWLVLARNAGSINGWTPSVGFWLTGWLSVATVLSWLFARRLSRPIRDFAAAARRVGNGEEFRPIPEHGPTEIRLVARSLNEMQARLARSVAERTAVVGAIAHDLRAPLSRLNFHLAALPDAVRRNAEAEISEMEQMIMVTLDFVEHETRPQRRDAVELALLVEGVVDNFADMGRDVRMRAASCATVSGDQLMLKRLFANLLDNAVKYGGSATVDVQREAAFAIVDVEDGGTGMTPADIERAFEPFYRAEPSRSRRTGGVGLGLSIVKSVALTHGGSVELANMAGGLRARVRLPLLADEVG